MPFNLGVHDDVQTHKMRMAMKRLGIIAGFVVLLLLLVANTLILSHQVSVQIANQAKVTHARQVIFALERTQSLLVNAETGQRGYLYTRDPKYLDTYELAIAQFDAHIDDLSQLTANEPPQQTQIPELRSLAKTKLAELAQSLSYDSSSRREEAKALVKSDAGLNAMNEIRNLVGEMEQEEASQEASRIIELKRSIRVIFICIYLSNLLGGLSLILLAYFILLEMKHHQKHLRETQEREEWYRVTLTSIGDAVICANYQGNITFLNLVAERLTGWRHSEAIGHHMDEVIHLVDATTRKDIDNPMVKALRQNRPGNLPPNCLLIRRDGHETFIEDSAAPIHDYDKKITGSVIVFRDVSMARALAEETVHASQHDALTGLPNRVLLNDRIGQAIALAPRHMGQVVLLFLDLDGFKYVNDSLGHVTGDKLLQSVTRRLQDCVRAPDTVSRQGGDEFVVLIQGVQNREDAAIAAERVLGAVSGVHSIDQHDLHVTASLGISVFPDDGLDAMTLLKNADTAMYFAKGSGHHCYKFFTRDMNVRAVERQSIEEDLRHALNRNEFTLHYQPKINLSSGAIIGAEALLRWTSPTRGSVPPLDFIQVAEDSGLILSIGAWVLQEACAQAKAWMDQGLVIKNIAVNVSAVQFLNERFIEDVYEALSQTGLDPTFLELELTESVLMHQPEMAASILRDLRNRGVMMAVDDFGTGYSSLSYLKKLPIDVLKIDKSFVHQLRQNPDDVAIVIAIISMGQSLNLRVIAEGVETVEDLAFLRANGCSEAQGFYFSRPVPAEQFAHLLNQPSYCMIPSSK
jgi:diguanylate cyclase (GGDEF)-like protein/PAS domain S-box-containing protein